MSELSNPHDKFFKETFSRLEIARDFLQNYLPPAVSVLLDISTLELRKDSFIDSDLQENFTDLLYRVTLLSGGEAYVYVLMEHKSYSDPLTPFQLLRYLVRIWERDLRQGQKIVSPIIPMVIYHGRERWTAVRDFQNLFTGPEALKNYWPAFTYELCDLSAFHGDEIRGVALAQIGLRLLRYIFDDQLTDRLPEIFLLFHQLANQKTALEYRETVLRYLSAATDRVTRQDLGQIIQTTLNEQGDKVMPTLAQQWIEEGIAKGLEQGQQVALRESILDLLQIRFGAFPELIATRLTKVEDLATLRYLNRRAATVETLTAFVEVLN